MVGRELSAFTGKRITKEMFIQSDAVQELTSSLRA